MRSLSSSCLFLSFLVASLSCNIRTAKANLALQMNIPYRGSECLYDTLEKGERLTAEIYILGGSQLKAMVTLDGPVASTVDVNTGLDLQESVTKYSSKGRYSYAQDASNVIKIKEIIDFEHFNIGKIPRDGDDDDDDDDHSKQPFDMKEQSLEERKAIKEKRRRKALEQRQKIEQKRLHQQNVVREEGEPFVVNIQAKEAGWYKMCILGSYYQVTAEVEVRKESDVGEIGKSYDIESGEVFGYDQAEMLAEDKLLDEDTADEEGIKEEDFISTKTKLKTLRHLMTEIHNRQNKERHRIVLHSAMNQHSHSRMVLSSLMETILFMVVTGFQVFTIRKWFKGAPMLGR